MNRSYLLLTCVLAFAAGAVSAEKGGKTPAKKMSQDEYIRYMQEAEKTGPDPELELQHYTRQLGLSKGQQAKVLKVLESRKALFEKEKDLRDEYKEKTRPLDLKLKELIKTYKKKWDEVQKRQETALGSIRSVLNDSQRETFDFMQEQREREERAWKKKRVEEQARREGWKPPKDGDQPPKSSGRNEVIFW